ncbi:DUF3127 domain-containing protein [Prevotella sp.]|uniref:DUF3127 domain-containing protein n=1 Tax=Prevotella sp. TaxID=59823 RepID=UPI002F936BB8
MDLQGKVIAALEPRRGTSARGEWVVQSFVIETHDAYPKKMVFEVFGEERLQRFNIQVGQEVNVSFDIDAHEYQGRWFNSIRAFDVRLVDANMGVPPMPQAPDFGPAPAPTAAPAQPSSPAPEAGSADDLPF